ncbi:MAG TPA: hypothetical protein VFL83_02905, partial [Anaeromyxobacter sp.]|nr:hypothetical protein [Anaeromyxobacter sp.]
MALTLAQVDEIAAHLRAVPALVDRLEERSVDTYEAALRWFHAAEAMLQRTRQPVVAQLASLRSLLVQAGRGQPVPEVELTGRPTRRKLRDGAVQYAIARASEALMGAIQPRLDQLEEADRLARQISAVLTVKGHVAACTAAAPDHATRVACLERRA